MCFAMIVESDGIALASAASYYGEGVLAFFASDQKPGR